MTTVSDPQTSKVVPLFQTLAWRVEAADPAATAIHAYINGWTNRAHTCSTGPKPPTKSSRKQTAKQLQTQATSVSRRNSAS